MVWAIDDFLHKAGPTWAGEVVFAVAMFFVTFMDVTVVLGCRHHLAAQAWDLGWRWVLRSFARG